MVRNGMLFLGCIVCIVVCAAAYFHAAIYAEMDSWLLIPRPEHFTELSFDNYTATAAHIPKHAARGQRIPFSFTIHNVEGRTMTYTYDVFVVVGHSTTTINSGTIAVPDGAAVHIPEVYVVRGAGDAVVSVSLPEQQESLHLSVPQ